MKKPYLTFAILIFFGLVSGFINGLLGTGGGILLVFVLSRLLREDNGYSARDVFATVIAAILPMSAVSAYYYLNRGAVAFSDASPYLISGIIGGLCGGLLLDKINLKFLKKLFAVMVIYAGFKMLFA